MSIADDNYYLKRVTELGDTHRLVTSQDVISTSGIKLVNKGVKIDSSFYDRLVQHRLLPELERCLTIEDAVDGSSLYRRACEIMESDALLARLAKTPLESKKILAPIARIFLTPELAFKVTMAREQRPEIFDHGLRVALIAIFLGIRIDLSDRELTLIAEAGLFHDLGELHIDPAILDKSRQLLESERRHIYAHPMTIYLLLKDFTEYHPHVSRAVLEHHERLDGSGYPSGLKSESISRFGKLLAVAEVAGGMFDENRMDIVLKLNQHKLDSNLIGLITSRLSQSGENQPSDSGRLENFERRLDELARIFMQWDAITGQIKVSAPLIALVNGRLFSLRQSLYDAGFNPFEMNHLTQGIDQDPAAIRDLETLCQESCWQLAAIRQEIVRSFPDFQTSSRTEFVLTRNWLTAAGELLGFATNR